MTANLYKICIKLLIFKNYSHLIPEDLSSNNLDFLIKRKEITNGQLKEKSPSC